MTSARNVVIVESVVPAPHEKVWERATTEEGIRHELMPAVRMTMPPGLRGKTLADADELLGKSLGKAWLFLLGVIPVDYDDMSIVDYEPGRYFHERSSMLSLKVWEHRRTITPDGAGTRVRDELTFVPRIPGFPAAPIVRWLFGHRHRRLAAYWSAA